MHLGGGRTSRPDDALLAFKAKFSPQRVPYYTGGLIYARGAYEQLARGRNERFLSYRFPPAPEIGSKPIALRRTTTADFADFFRLKCDVDNIVWSGHDRPPDWHRMSTWFAAQHAPGSRRRIYLAEYEGQVLGYTYVDDLDDAVEITVGISAREAGRGLGRNFLKQVMAVIRAGEREIRCWLFPENVAGVRAFEAAGFRRDAGKPARSFAMPFGDGPIRQSCWVYDGAAPA
jgi:L-amino acid N-acyltransferase YncA